MSTRKKRVNKPHCGRMTRSQTKQLPEPSRPTGNQDPRNGASSVVDDLVMHTIAFECELPPILRDKLVIEPQCSRVTRSQTRQKQGPRKLYPRNGACSRDHSVIHTIAYEDKTSAILREQTVNNAQCTRVTRSQRRKMDYGLLEEPELRISASFLGDDLELRNIVYVGEQLTPSELSLARLENGPSPCYNEVIMTVNHSDGVQRIYRGCLESCTDGEVAVIFQVPLEVEMNEPNPSWPVLS